MGNLLKVGHRKRERIRSVGAGRRGESQYHAHHLRDLVLVGPTAARDGPFHMGRCVFVHLQSCASEDQEYDAARMTKFRRGLRVFGEK